MHTISGMVVGGLGLGTQLGYPTANIMYDMSQPALAPGVYAGFARVDDVTYPAAVAVGARQQTPVLVEAHLIGFSGDLLGAQLTLEIKERVSDMLRCETTRELMQKIADDIARVKKILNV